MIVNDVFTRALTKHFGHLDTQRIDELYNDVLSMEKDGVHEGSFIGNLRGKGKGKACQALSELLVYRVLRDKGFLFQRKEDARGKPDLTVVMNNQTLVIELISAWEVDEEVRSRVVYSNELGSPLLLRQPEEQLYLSATLDSFFLRVSKNISTKRKAFRQYIDNGVVLNDQPLIITLNVGFIAEALRCNSNAGLSEVDFTAKLDDFFSNLYGAKHIAIDIDDNFKVSYQESMIDMIHTVGAEEFNVSKFSASSDGYRKADYSFISGIWCLNVNERGCIERSDFYSNPNAKNKIQDSILRAFGQWHDNESK